MRIQTFGEYLDICQAYGKVPFIETKGDVSVVAPLLAELRRRGLLSVTVLSSIGFDHFAEARRLDRDTPEAVARMLALGLDYIPTNVMVPEALQQ